MTIKKQQASDKTDLGRARAAAGKYRADTTKEFEGVATRIGLGMAQTYGRKGENLERRAQAGDKKMTDLSVKHSRAAVVPLVLASAAR